MRHAQPTEDENDITDLGRQQVQATCEAHLKRELRFPDACASSEMSRAKATLDCALAAVNGFPHPYERHATLQLGYAWLFGDARFGRKPWPMPTPRPMNALELVREWPISMALGMKAWEFLEQLVESVWFMGFNATFQTGEPTELNGRVLVVSHSGIIEAIPAVVPRVSPIHLGGIPTLGHADILRVDVEWSVTPSEALGPVITAIEHLPCPIKTPA